MSGDVVPFERPIRWAKLRTDEAERVIRKLAADTSKVGFADHAFDRVEERSITQQDAYTILREGFIEGAPEKVGDGDWKVVVTKRMPGTRDAGVVTIILREGERLFVCTVEWMDWVR